MRGAVPRHPEQGLRPPLPPGSIVLSPAPGNRPCPGPPAVLPGTSGGQRAAGGQAAPQCPARASGAVAGKEQQRHWELWRRNRGSRAPRRINNS